MYQEIKVRARVAILADIEREREGDQIDKALLKNVLEIFIEVRSPCISHRVARPAVLPAF